MRGAKNYFIFLVLCMILVFFCFTWFGSPVESWLIVDAVPRHYVGVSDAGGDLLSAYWLQFPAGSVSITNEVATVYYAGAYQQNLLTNTQWIFCSNSDTAKGIATMTYDAGAAGGGDIPDPGDSGTGGTSGATCKIISVTVSTGAFATNDATGTIQIGASAGRFHDNETVTFDDGETVVVNHPNSAAGVDLVQNGELSVDTDPPPGWTAVNDATLTTEAGGKIGNCLMITEGGSNDPYAGQNITVTTGKIYYFVAYVKAGTEATYRAQIWDNNNNVAIYTKQKEETAGDWSTSVTQYFEVPANCSSISIRLFQICSAAAGTTIYFDEVSCYEVTPGCTGADNLAFDGWRKDSTLDIYRQHDDSTYTKDGGFYSAKLVPSVANNWFATLGGSFTNAPDSLYKLFAGKTVTLGMWVLTSTANHAYLRIRTTSGVFEDGSYHTGGGSWEWLELTHTIPTNVDENLRFYLYLTQSSGIVYISQPILVFGSSIGQGNYVPESDKRIYFEKHISSQTFHNKTGASGFSDVSDTELNLEADSGGCIGKGVRSVRVCVVAGDSGSAGTDCYFRASSDLSDVQFEFYCSPYGLANDTKARAVSWIPCNESGNFEYKIEASGGSTFDIPNFTYVGAEWR